jgi:signal transduction histidine kinase
VDKMLDLSLVNSYADIECNDTVNPANVAAQAIEQSGIRKAAHLDFQLQMPTEVEALTFVTNEKSAVKALALLLDNAAKFTHPSAAKRQKGSTPKEHVTLSISTNGQQVVYAVEDTGVGIPPEQAENIFTEFVQLDEYSDGTGIGLSIARSLARHINGDIVLDTTYTNGARFVMSLPL